MTKQGKNDCTSKLGGQNPHGKTNLWDGLLASMDLLRGAQEKGVFRRTEIMLLTDGMPTISPPRGHHMELRDYQDQYTDFKPSISTFGFGYELDSEVLLDIAKEANGLFHFVPTSIVLGTNFINSCANILCNFSQSAKVTVMLSEGVKFAGPIQGGYAFSTETWGRQIDIGPLQCDQERDIAIPLLGVKQGTDVYMTVAVTYIDDTGKEQEAILEATNRTV